MADTVLGGFVKPSIQRQLAFMEDELSGRAWFAGDEFSAADVMMSFPLEAAAARGGLDARYPRLSDDRPRGGNDPSRDLIKEVELWDLVSALRIPVIGAPHLVARETVRGETHRGLERHGNRMGMLAASTSERTG